MGVGRPIVKAATWMSHLQFDWESPIWRHWIEGLAAQNGLVRYDERGNGLSDRQVDDLSFEAMVVDLEGIVDAAQLDRFTLLGISQGCAISIAYAVKHPERLSHLVLYGGYAQGWRARGDPDEIAQRAAMGTLMRQGWGMDNPASDAAWGRPDRMLDAIRAGLADFERVVAEHSPSSPMSIAALYKLGHSLNRTSQLFDVGRATVSTRVRELNSELGQRLFKHYRDSEHADSYLVRGVVIVTDRDGQWDERFPEYEVPLGVEEPGSELLLNIPSAHHLFVSNREWQAAYEIVKLRKDAFTTPGLKGWRAVTLANVNPAEAVTRFDEAADAFDADAMPVTDEERVRRGGHWSSANQQLWAKYFRARARVVESIRTPDKVKTRRPSGVRWKTPRM
jgi:pimeloyl-ACP methyl ester carboxylesterase